MSALSAFLALGSIAEGEFVFAEIPSVGAYSRQPIDLEPMGCGKMVNDADIQFPVITSGSWPLFNAYAIFDAASGGNQLTPKIYSPEHKLTGREIREDSASSSHRIFKQVALTLASTTKTFEGMVKRTAGARDFSLRVQRSDYFTDARFSLNLVTGATGQAAAAGFTISSLTAVAVEDWWYYTFTLAIAAGVGANPYIYHEFFRSSESPNDNYPWDGASKLGLWAFRVR